MTLDDIEEEISLWAINLDSYQVFNAMGTQWRHGMAGPTGLDYGVLPGVMDLIGIAPERRKEVFSDVRVLESEALATMAEE